MQIIKYAVQKVMIHKIYTWSLQLWNTLHIIIKLLLLSYNRLRQTTRRTL